MKNKKAKGAGYNAKGRLGHSKKKPQAAQPQQQAVDTAESSLDMLLPGQKGPSGPTTELAPDLKAQKLGAKKQKRLDAFIKLSAKEKLRTALLEERAGVPKSDESVRLLVTRDTVDSMIDETDESSDEEMQVEETAPKSGIVSRAFGAESLVPQVFESSHGGGTTKIDPNAPKIELLDTSVSKGSALKLKSTVKGAALKSVQGSALKTSTSKGSALKRKGEDNKGTSKKSKVEESSESEESSDSEADDPEPTPSTSKGGKHASIWMSDVVNGDKVAVKPVASKPQVQEPKKVEKPSTPARPAFYVPVNRPEDIQLARMSLPVVGEEQSIMEAIIANDVVLLCGETGSGKTTQVPQFLYEAGFGDPTHPKFPGMVGVTQPRRVAAVSMAERVAHELGVTDGTVSYQIRYDKGQTSRSTRIKFMTDGILLRELSSGTQKQSSKGKNDLLLSAYSCIIIDEAHERTVGTDILIGWLTRIVKLRNSGKIKGIGPLKLVIMSATLRVEDFTENPVLFPRLNGELPPPILKVDGRQHKVTVHYNKKTPELDFIGEAYKKVCKIHTKLPVGGILVFVTSQQEVTTLVRKLKKGFPFPNTVEKETDGIAVQGKNELCDLFDGDAVGFDDSAHGAVEDGEDDFDLLMREEEDEEEEEVHVLPGTIEEGADEPVVDEEVLDSKTPLHVLPLYSLLPTKEQMRVFDAPPPGSRLVVIATNVAETSLTIPGIRYVVDCGKAKETGIQRFQVAWTNAASADQRAGRSGRTGPGHCYRLFSSAVFTNYFEPFSKPEILKVPIQGVVLSMKSMGMNQIVGFPFPTAPDANHLKDAETLLKHLDAIGSDKKITQVGRWMALFPIHPRYGKMLVVAAKQAAEVLPYIIAIVAGLSVGEVFVRDADLLNERRPAPGADEDEDPMDESEKEERKDKRGKFFKKMQLFAGTHPTSDAITILRAIGAYLAQSKRKSDMHRWCEDHFLRFKAMDEVIKLMQQLVRLVSSGLAVDTSIDSITPPTAKQESLIRQILLTGYVDCVARLDENNMSGHGKHAVPVYQTMWSNDTERFVIHPASCLFRERPAPKWVCFDQVQARQQMFGPDGQVIQLRVSNDGTEKKWLKGITLLSDSWLIEHAPSLTNTGAILDQPEPMYDSKTDGILGFVSPTFGPKFWQLPVSKKVVTNGKEASSWFARALLEGSIDFGHGKNVNEHLPTKPSVITKSWSKGQAKVSQTLALLSTNKISSRKAIIDKWSSDPAFMLDEYLLWVPSPLHKILKQNWPPVSIVKGKCMPNMGLVNSVKGLLEKVARPASHSDDDS